HHRTGQEGDALGGEQVVEEGERLHVREAGPDPEGERLERDRLGTLLRQRLRQRQGRGNLRLRRLGRRRLRRRLVRRALEVVEEHVFAFIGRDFQQPAGDANRLVRRDEELRLRRRQPFDHAAVILRVTAVLQ